MFKRILVPLDGSDLAEKVLPHVRTIARSSNAEIVLLRIAEYPYDLYAGCDAQSLFDPVFDKKTVGRKKAIQDDLAEYLEQITSNLQQDGLRVIAEVCDGPVVDTILTSTDRLCVDLIVMSSLGDGGGNPCMIGSVADRVLRESTVQVFLVRPDQGDIKSDTPQNQNESYTRIPYDFSKYRYHRTN